MLDFTQHSSSQLLSLLEDEAVKFPIRQGWINLDAVLSWTSTVEAFFNTKAITHAFAFFFFFVHFFFGDISQNIKYSVPFSSPYA